MDFWVQNEGSIVILWPISEEGQEWVDTNIVEYTPWGTNGVVIEHRYVGPVLDGIEADGLEVEQP